MNLVPRPVFIVTVVSSSVIYLGEDKGKTMQVFQ